MRELHDGRALFGSRVVISFYTTLVPLALGWIAGPMALANFSLADKLRTAAQALLSPLSQALFPRMTHLFATDKSAAFHLLKRSALTVFVFAGTASLLLWGLAEWLVVVLAGPEFASAAQTLRWLAFLPLIINLSSTASVQVLLSNNKNREFNVVLIGCSVAGLPFLFLSVKYGETVGAAVFMLCIEFIIMTFMMLLSAKYLYEKGIK
jgi:PST family polysaccharide transporter